MNGPYSVSITVGRETSPKELGIITSLLPEKLDYRINNSHVRMSDGGLPLSILIQVGVQVGSDLLINLIKYAFAIIKSKDLSRERGVNVKTASEEILIGGSYIAIRKEQKDIQFKSSDDLIEYLKNSR